MKCFIQYYFDLNFDNLHEELEENNTSIEEWCEKQREVFDVVKREYKNDRKGIARLTEIK